MKLLSLILVMVIAICITYEGSFLLNEKENISSGNLIETELELRTEITETKYCDGSDMLITLKLIYKNTGSNNIILNKYISTVHAYRVFKNMKNFKSGKYEQEGFFRYNALGSEPKIEDFNSSTFAILQPGEEYALPFERKVSASLEDGTEDCEGEGEGCLKPGKHILQLSVVNWLYSKELANNLKEKWKNYGDLFTKSILSLPLEFEVEPPNKRKISNCN